MATHMIFVVKVIEAVVQVLPLLQALQQQADISGAANSATMSRHAGSSCRKKHVYSIVGNTASSLKRASWKVGH